ncbi:MAG: hypothetical protein KC561_16660, partial [Myxococcales bacterium]|nr:hypothetical protein [Myxococcales bacterium]
MRIAVGVLLILVALLNGCAGAGVTILGGAAAAVGEGMAEVSDNLQQQPNETDEAFADRQQAAQ